MDKLFKILFTLAVLTALNDIGGWGLLPEPNRTASSAWTDALLSPVYSIIEKETGIHIEGGFQYQLETLLSTR